MLLLCVLTLVGSELGALWRTDCVLLTHPFACRRYLVAQTIQNEFAGSTVIIVAHRVKTIMGCDRVLVFDQGRLVEAGHPHELASNPKTLFHGLSSGSEFVLL